MLTGSGDTVRVCWVSLPWTPEPERSPANLSNDSFARTQTSVVDGNFKCDVYTVGSSAHTGDGDSILYNVFNVKDEINLLAIHGD